MKRWLLAAVFGMLCLVPAPVALAAGGGAVGMEMLVLLPEQGELAVYQQVVMKTPAPAAQIGVLSGAREVAAVGVSAVQATGNEVVVEGAPRSFALRYFVPWNGRSGTYAIPTFLPTQALVLLVPESLAVPQVLNPALVSAGHGKIPGIPQSPVFQEFATANLAQGQRFSMVIEAAGLSAASAAPVALPVPSPWLSRGIEAAALLVAAFGVWAAVNWRPAWQWSRRRMVRERLLAELAQLDAGYRRGEVAEGDWRRLRAELFAALKEVWGHGDRGR
ncbi:MAG: hypothetical protein K6U14_08945 [Firmicutes bacterium]|nr:hypothetical protein [Alicyclobacillaceae bacterium]MCL6497737.1 hypothetical protein [Bacillota bacterium]